MDAGALYAKSQNQSVLKGAITGGIIGGGIGSVASSLMYDMSELSSNAFKILSKGLNQGMTNALTTMMQNGDADDVFRNSIIGVGAGSISGYIGTRNLRWNKNLRFKDNETAITLNSDGIGNIIGKTLNGIAIKGLQAVKDNRSSRDVFFHSLHGGLDGFVGASISEMIFKETILPKEILKKDISGSLIGSISGIGASAIQVSSIYLMESAAVFGDDLSGLQRLGFAGGGLLFRFLNLNKHFKDIGYKNYMIKDLYQLLLVLKKN